MASRLGDQISADHLKLVFCVISSYPLALIYRTLPAKYPIFRHIFSIIYAIFTMGLVLKFYEGTIHIGLTALFTYIFMKWYRGNNGAYINFVIVMLSLSICHIDRKIKGYEGSSKLDYSGPLMVAIIKLSSFGFNITDGRSNNATTAYNERMKIVHYPSLIEFFGWICFFGGFLVGPTSEYMDYYRYTNTFFISKERYISPYAATLRQITLGIIAAIVMILVGHTYNYSRMLDDTFLNIPLYKKLVFLNVVGLVERCKFSCIWLLAEGGCVLSGFGYNGIKQQEDGTQKHQWDRLRNVDWIACETAQSFKDLSNGWNVSTNNWLRHYVYNRVTPPGTKPTSRTLAITYITSALWHGFYPGYYALFIPFGMFQSLSRRIRRTIRPFFVINSSEGTSSPTSPSMLRVVWKKTYDFMGYLISMTLIAILVVPFELLHFSRIRKVWSSIYYLHIWGYMLTWIILGVIESVLFSMQQKQRKQQEVLDNQMNHKLKELKQKTL
ncbi:MBOAT, membrane-bound O-acyltransferase family-domain-containing protein [Phascolomyces articulosus]|uniref:MBOAT, membrane-bound O-acyltransferase family-domain-containing protein n=1 Tax=Phascolomyces articulosus TaxID=60185 RepID=A0AAD5KGZ1_9FUNG|nr:MBOAT, membrane-bound O-acyltransferase family-domain-containing protein [Phascolomyces articulosus]